MKLKELAISERPRERMIAQGREMLSNSELLAILIRTGTRDRTAIGLGEDLLSLGKEGLVYLEGCSLEELSRVKGIGMAKACQISAAIELGKRMATCPRTKRIAISGTADVVSLFMERMRYYKKEYFNTLLVNAKGEVICNETVSIGDLSSSIVHPRETFTEAVKRCAYGVILVHNHPSGNPEPSKEDIEATARLCASANLLGIKILDHIIIGDGVFTSFKAIGLI